MNITTTQFCLALAGAFAAGLSGGIGLVIAFEMWVTRYLGRTPRNLIMGGGEYQDYLGRQRHQGHTGEHGMISFRSLVFLAWGAMAAYWAVTSPSYAILICLVNLAAAGVYLLVESLALHWWDQCRRRRRIIGHGR